MYTTKPAAERAYTAYRAQLHSMTTELVAIAKAGEKKVGPGPGWHGPPKGTHVPRKETALWASRKTIEIKLASGKKTRVDVGIAPLTQTLNNSGLETTHSCSGHSGSEKSVETQISFRHTTRSEPAVKKLRGIVRSGELSQSWVLTDRPMNFHSLHLRRGFYGDRSLPSTNEQIGKVKQDLGRFQKELELPKMKADLAGLQTAIVELAVVVKAGKEKTGPGKGWHGPPVGTHAPTGKAKLPEGVEVRSWGKPSANAVSLVEHVVAANPPSVTRAAKAIFLVEQKEWAGVCRSKGLKIERGVTVHAFHKLGSIYISERYAKPEFVNHELGHLAQRASKRGYRWTDAYERSSRFDRHTKYSRASPREGFAVSYASYISTGGVAKNPKYAATYAVVEDVISGIEE